MKTVFVVMGHEFESSWPVRAFSDSGAADAFRDLLVKTYRERSVVTAVDLETAKELEAENDEDVRRIAEMRAMRELHELKLDPDAGGLELGWDVVGIPLDEDK